MGSRKVLRFSEVKHQGENGQNIIQLLLFITITHCAGFFVFFHALRAQVWLDADAAVVRQERRLEEIIARAPDKDLIVRMPRRAAREVEGNVYSRLGRILCRTKLQWSVTSLFRSLF